VATIPIRIAPFTSSAAEPRIRIKPNSARRMLPVSSQKEPERRYQNDHGYIQ
jgi:hypothetical protein